ncbi:Citreoviridin biosynthesis protein [Salix suchowensis]|nr:Citreoviridin biosynthesis protein [Salix suchowensis]
MQEIVVLTSRSLRVPEPLTDVSDSRGSDDAKARSEANKSNAHVPLFLVNHHEHKARFRIAWDPIPCTDSPWGAPHSQQSDGLRTGRRVERAVRTWANSSYFHPFTGVHGIDGFICGLVAFFHAELEPQLSPYLLYFAGTSGFLMAFPAIEAHRKGRSLFIAFPIIVGLLGQTITIGITLTIYWLAFIWTGASSRRADAHSHITKPQAESIIFATAVGSMLPSMGLMLFKDPKVTAYWQIFPVYASIAGLAYGLLRPAPRTTESGYKLVRQMYMGMFVSSAIMHLWIVGPKLLEPPALASFVFPSTTSLPTTASLSAKADDFLKWTSYSRLVHPSLLPCGLLAMLQSSL